MTSTTASAVRFRRWISLVSAVALAFGAFGTAPTPVRAAGITVTTTTDELNADGDCSLREAVQAANTNVAVDACPAGSASETDTVQLDNLTYTLGLAGTGEDGNATGDLDITGGGPIAITGTSFGRTVISGGFSDRVIDVIGSAANVRLSFMSIRDGLTLDEGGGGIRSNGDLILFRVVVEQNNVLGNTSSAMGGGVCIGCGAGTGSATLQSSSIRNNTARAGAGMFTNRPTTLDWTSVVSNTARLGGGAIVSYDDLTLRDSLISSNVGTLYTGGIDSYGVITITNSTISHNLGGSGHSGGLASYGSGTSVNSIVSNNTPVNCSVTPALTSGGHNLSSDATCAANFTTAGDLNSTGPLLGDLQLNGYGTLVRPLIPGSPAIDAGDTVACTTRDERLIPRLIDGNGDGSAACDIGAFEFAPRLYVDGTVVGFQDGLTWATALSNLQDALAFASRGTEIWVAAGVYHPDRGVLQTPDDRASAFALKDLVSLYGGFVGTEAARAERDPGAHRTVLSGDLTQDDVNADGNSIAESYADIIGANAYHVVVGGSGLFGTLDGFTITAGKADGTTPNNVGGGMYNVATSVSIANTLFSGNRADGGGGLLNTGAGAVLTNVTFQGNYGGYGGGLQNDNGSLVTLTNVTFYANVGVFGGGVFNANSNPTFVNVTLSGNSASAALGGGIYNAASAPTLKNTLIADSVSGGDCVNGAGGFIAAGSTSNLIEDAAAACGLSNGVDLNIVGFDPRLGGFGFAGGATPVVALRPGSVAIDTGSGPDCPVADQRGVARPQGVWCDIGAFEYRPTLYLPTLSR